ncbi:MAG: magnesium transporter CorA [Bacteroidetes bacterium]|mgnify:CR=1 FL=1|nr:magnesium transporter CorA [Bacteroidota bacterium]
MPIQKLSIDDLPYQWLDIVMPSETELNKLSKEFHLHRYTLRDCLEPDHLPKYEDLGETRFIITRVLLNPPTNEVKTLQEMSTKLAIFYNEHFILTIHRLPQEFLKDIKLKYLENGKCRTTNELVTKIIWNVLHTYDDPVIQLSEEAEECEIKIFLKNLQSSMLEELYIIKRKAAVCNKLLLLTGEVISTIRTDENDLVALQDVKDLHKKLMMMYNQVHEDVTNLLNIYLSLSAQRTNEVVKLLTIFSVFFMPLTFIVGVYGMNFHFMPELETRWGYPAVLLLMAIIIIVIFLWFKRKKWL